MPASTRRAATRSPYAIEDLTITLRRSRLGAAWRWRTELFAAAVLLAAYVRLAVATSLLLAALVFGGTLAGLLAVPHSRRFLAARLWCLLTRHRLQRAFWELRLHTRAGHLPWVLWTRGTRVGERAWVLSRAGMCAEDFENAAPEFAAACAAREARVTASARWSQLVTIDILRRDLLAPRTVVPSTLAGMAGPVVVPAPVPDPEPVTGPGPAAWPEIGPGDTRS